MMECKCEIGGDRGHEIVKVCRTHGNHVDKMTEGLRLKVAELEQENADFKEQAEHWEATCHAQWESSIQSVDDCNSLTKENARLKTEIADYKLLLEHHGGEG
jgi:hypothetical protein